jgi:O-antigen ligase
MSLNMPHQQYQYTYIRLLMCVFVLYPFSIKLSNAAIILLAAHWLFALVRTPRVLRWNQKFVWLLIGLYIVTALSALYSENLRSTMMELEKKLPLLILPLVIGTSPVLTAKQLKKIINFGSWTVVAVLIFCLAAAAVRKLSGHPEGFFWRDLTSPLDDLHPSYFTLYINFFITWLMVILLRDWDDLDRGKKISVFSRLVLFYIAHVLLASKIHLMIAGIIPVACGLLLLSRQQLRWIVPAAVVVLLLGAIAMLNTQTGQRFRSIEKYSYELDSPVSEFNELTIRLALAECSWLVLRESPVLGVGAGDVQKKLDSVYRAVDYKYGYLDQQNPHNQYLSQWLATGLAGLAVLLYILATSARFAYKHRLHDFLILTALFGISFFTESILERQKGIVLFSLLFSLYLFTEHDPPGRPEPTTQRLSSKNPS